MEVNCRSPLPMGLRNSLGGLLGTVASAALVLPSQALAAECFNVYANQGWQSYRLLQSYPSRMSISVSGEWTINREKYAPISPLVGHLEPTTGRRHPRYKYDSRHPFGVLLYSADGQTSERLASFTRLPQQGWLRINDSDATSNNNSGMVRICVAPA